MRHDIESVRREVARKAPLGDFYALGFSRWVVTWKFIYLLSHLRIRTTECLRSLLHRASYLKHLWVL
jgi:hypothetical protein